LDGNGTSVMFAVIPLLRILMIFFYIVMIVISVYCFILFIKLAHRGIKALDIYIKEKQ
jgi:hypothetical protein